MTLAYDQSSNGPVSVDAPTAPLVTVVTASLNSARYIEDAIRSVRDQDYPHIQHIVVDGGSKDGTVEILRRYDGEVEWLSEPDRGQSDAINKGWRRARGSILGWLDADNVYEPSAVREAVEIFQQHPEVGLVYGAVRDVDEEGEVVREFVPPAFSLERLLLDTGFNFIAPSSTFIRQSVLDQAGLLDPELHYTMDYDLCLRVGLVTQVMGVERFWSRFRVHGTSKTGSRMDGFGWDILRVLKKLYARPDLPDNLRRIRRQAHAQLYKHAADRIITTDFKNGRKYYVRAFLASPFTASATLLKTIAYLYYRDTPFGKGYRGLKRQMQERGLLARSE